MVSQQPVERGGDSSSSRAKRVQLSRRTFAKAAAGAMIVPRHVLGGFGYQAPSEKLAVAAVGIGGMGASYLKGCEHEQIVALCDCNRTPAEPVFRRYPDARQYSNFREMFDKEANNFDALIIGTPDHTHAVILLDALKLGKHVYCAKPVTHDVYEARRVREAVLRAGVITQTSVQSAASSEARGTEEILRCGALGPIREVHVWTPHPVYPCSLERPNETPPVPAGLDWDLWLGPAPHRPYHPAYVPFKWCAWWDFGSGTVADMACHSFHVFFHALQLDKRQPRTVSAYSSYHRDPSGRMLLTRECESDANQVTWDYPPIDDLPALRLCWYDGGMRPQRPAEIDTSWPMPAAGLLFIGEEGKMLSGFSGGGDVLLPAAKFQDFRRPAAILPRTVGHYREWTEGCRTNTPTNCPLEFGCQMTEMALLGTIALRTLVPDRLSTGWPAQLLQWDAGAMQFTNHNGANACIKPPRRTGWEL